MPTISLSSGETVLIDTEDVARVSQWKWKRHKGGYACRSTYRTGKTGLCLMHRFIMGEPEGLEVHHDNEDKLDNRKANLIIKTPLEHRKEHAHVLVAFQKSRQRYPDTKLCAVCDSPFAVNPRKRKRHKTCSLGCAMAMRIAGRKRQAASFPKSQHVTICL